MRIIVTVPPGGASDFVARTLSESFAKELGTPVLIENKGGANGTIASAYVARAPADGYTLLQAGISTHGIGPYFYDNLPYAPFKDLVPVGPIAEFPIILAVNAQLPVKSVADLIALAKTRPMSFASAGTGSAPHLSGELFKIETGVNLVHVPYKGSAPAVVDVASGQVDMMFDGIPALLPHIKSGKLRPIAAVSVKRNSQMPELPTFTELGYPSMVASVWYGHRNRERRAQQNARDYRKSTQTRGKLSHRHARKPGGLWRIHDQRLQTLGGSHSQGRHIDQGRLTGPHSRPAGHAPRRIAGRPMRLV